MREDSRNRRDTGTGAGLYWWRSLQEFWDEVVWLMEKAMGEIRERAGASRRGFTLTEMLIVIVVIGILAGLLMPSIWRAHQSAYATQCKNNLHQLHLSIELYRRSNDETYPYAAKMPSLKLNELPGIAEVLEREVTNSKVFKCPSDKQGYYAREGSSYEYNTRLGGRQVLSGRFAEVLGETRTPLFFDYEDFHGQKGTPGARNYVYVDGHIEGALAQESETEEEE